MVNMSETNEVGLVGKTSNASLDKLTPRQLDVLALLCEGMPNKLIGRRLNIASGTVKVHIAHILRALNVASRLQAVLAARALGLDLVRGDARQARPLPSTASGHPVGLHLVVSDEEVAPFPATPATSARVAALA